MNSLFPPTGKWGEKVTRNHSNGGPQFGACLILSDAPVLTWAKSPIASVQRTRSTLASHSAVPCGTNVKRTNANRAI